MGATSSGGIALMSIEVRSGLTSMPPLKPAIGRAKPERLEQHGHAARRPAAGDGESDVGLVELAHRRPRALGDHLVRRDERPVDVGENESNSNFSVQMTTRPDVAAPSSQPPPASRRERGGDPVHHCQHARGTALVRFGERLHRDEPCKTAENSPKSFARSSPTGRAFSLRTRRPDDHEAARRARDSSRRQTAVALTARCSSARPTSRTFIGGVILQDETIRQKSSSRRAADRSPDRARHHPRHQGRRGRAADGGRAGRARHRRPRRASRPPRRSTAGWALASPSGAR